MNQLTKELANALYGREDLKDCDWEDMRSLAHQYPFFPTAHYLLLEKTRLEDPASLHEQWKHSSVYFSNLLWLEYLLNQPPEKQDTRPLPAAGTSAELKAEKEEDHYNDELVLEIKHEAPGITESHHFTPEQPPAEVLKLADFKISKSEETTLFEPFHTVDYFASQGIRTSPEEKPADRFGQQLKSFTDWLKTMKKLPAAEVSGTISPASEQNVVTMASHSVEQTDVVTESMAEVWIKQGETDRAIAIYRKLSLLDPSKSAYFAGLIDQLKQS